jgi:hypothetical protein
MQFIWNKCKRSRLYRCRQYKPTPFKAREIGCEFVGCALHRLNLAIKGVFQYYYVLFDDIEAVIYLEFRQLFNKRMDMKFYNLQAPLLANRNGLSRNA